MIAVIFELEPAPGGVERYLDLAAKLGGHLADVDGFVSMERFESLTTPGRILSLSFWRDEAAVAAWRNTPEHRATQREGRLIFKDYRLRVAHVLRDYGMTRRDQAPPDSRNAHPDLGPAQSDSAANAS